MQRRPCRLHPHACRLLLLLGLKIRKQKQTNTGKQGQTKIFSFSLKKKKIFFKFFLARESTVLLFLTGNEVQTTKITERKKFKILFFNTKHKTKNKTRPHRTRVLLLLLLLNCLVFNFRFPTVLFSVFCSNRFLVLSRWFSFSKTKKSEFFHFQKIHDDTLR
jgi:hypothetical protein